MRPSLSFGASAAPKMDGSPNGDASPQAMAAVEECFKKARREVRLSAFEFIALTLAGLVNTTSVPFYRNTHFFYKIFRHLAAASETDARNRIATADYDLGADRDETCLR